MTEALVLAALREAIRWRQPGPGLIHHSDRGGQCAGGEYRQVLRRARMRAAREEIRAYLCYYDTKRRHSSLNYLTPCEFELCQE